jgi:hypothetical protein
MTKIKFILLKRELSEAGNEYVFNNYNLGSHKVDIVPRIGETVFYEVDDDEFNGVYQVTLVDHHLEPKSPPVVTLILAEDETYFKP